MYGLISGSMQYFSVEIISGEHSTVSVKHVFTEVTNHLPRTLQGTNPNDFHLKMSKMS